MTFQPSTSLRMALLHNLSRTEGRIEGNLCSASDAAAVGVSSGCQRKIW